MSKCTLIYTNESLACLVAQKNLSAMTIPNQRDPKPSCSSAVRTKAKMKMGIYHVSHISLAIFLNIRFAPKITYSIFVRLEMKWQFTYYFATAESRICNEGIDPVKQKLAQYHPPCLRMVSLNGSKGTSDLKSTKLYASLWYEL